MICIERARSSAVSVSVVALVAGTISACGSAAPRSPMECIAPAAAGGGWDLTCRITARGLSELSLISGTMRVTNLPGAGGGVAYANAVTRRAGDSRTLVAASPSTLLGLAQGHYGRMTARDVRWVGTIAADVSVVAVQASAPWRTLEEFMAAWREQSGAISIGGGSAVGGQDHVKALLLARAAGIPVTAVRYVPFDGGGEATTALLGGFVGMVPGDASGVIQHMEAGTIRVLAVLAPERLPGPFADVPTAREAGYDVEWLVWRGFYLPPRVPDSEYGAWITRLGTLVESDLWQETMERYGLVPFVTAGPEFESMVQRQIESFRELSRQIGLVR